MDSGCWDGCRITTMAMRCAAGSCGGRTAVPHVGAARTGPGSGSRRGSSLARRAGHRVDPQRCGATGRRARATLRMRPTPWGEGGSVREDDDDASLGLSADRAAGADRSRGVVRRGSGLFERTGVRSADRERSGSWCPPWTGGPGTRSCVLASSVRSHRANSALDNHPHRRGASGLEGEKKKAAPVVGGGAWSGRSRWERTRRSAWRDESSAEGRENAGGRPWPPAGVEFAELALQELECELRDLIRLREDGYPRLHEDAVTG